MKEALKIGFAVVFSLWALGASSQQGDIEAQNAVKRRSQERLAEIERLNKALSGDIVRSERDLRVARSTIDAKRRVAAELDAETRRITAEMNADMRATRRLDSTLERLKLDYGRMVRMAWRDHKTMGATLFLLSSRDFNDASRRIDFIRRVNRMRARRGAEIDSLSRSLQTEIERLAAKKTEIAGLKAESDNLLADLGREEKRYETALKTLGNDRNKLEAEAAQERAKIAAAQREIERIMERQAREARVAASSDATEMALTGQFGDNKGLMPWPTGRPGLILHHFGTERGADGIASDFKGLIIAAAPGSAVKAVFEGTVSGIFDLGQYEKCVTVRSGEYVVGYGNISSLSVKNGDKVATGATLGNIGTSGNPDRLRVLLWIQRGNTVLDPEEWLK